MHRSTYLQFPWRKLLVFLRCFRAQRGHRDLTGAWTKRCLRATDYWTDAVVVYCEDMRDAI